MGSANGNSGPIGVVPVTLFLFTWPTKDMMQHAERRSWKRLDFLGCFLLIAASVLVVFSFQEGGLVHGLQPSSWHLYSLAVSAGSFSSSGRSTSLVARSQPSYRLACLSCESTLPQSW